MVLDIPVTRNVAVHGGRRSAQAQPFADNALWEMQFGVRGGGVAYELSGVGMHPNGRPGHDDFDRVLLPRFGSFADLSTGHPEYFAPRFARDVAPVRENYRWELTLASNLPAQAFESTGGLTCRRTSTGANGWCSTTRPATRRWTC
jgi:hypothetical protein